MSAVLEASKPQILTRLEPVAHTSDTLDRWVTWMNNPEIRKWMDVNLPSSTEDINIWLFNATHDPRRHYFSINAEGREVGFISLRQDEAPQSTGEIGIVIGESGYHSRGLGTQALRSVLDYAENDLKLSAVRAHILPENEKSIRLFTRSGFTKTGDVTVNTVPMVRFERQFAKPENPAQTEAQELFKEIGLTRPTGTELGKAAVEFAAQLRKGGIGHDPDSSLMMTDTLLRLPDRETLKTHAGRSVFMVEFGGTNIRVSIGEVGPDGTPRLSIDPATDAPRMARDRLTKKHFASPDELFAEVFRVIDMASTSILPVHMPSSVGIMWSFEGNPVKTETGIDMVSPDTLSKGLIVRGIHNRPIGEQFTEALRRQYYSGEPQTGTIGKVVLNDTSAVLFSQIPDHPEQNQLGLENGAGFNISVRLDGTTYNLECGNFDGIPLPHYAEALDQLSDDPGKYIAEKQSSGLYVGDQFDTIVGTMADRGILSGTKVGRLSARDMDDVLRGDKLSLETKLGGLLSADEFAAISQAAVLLRDRAAYIIGTMIGTIVRVYGVGFGDTVSVPTEGTFILKSPGMKEIIQSIATSVAGRPVSLTPGSTLGILGTVAAAASQ